LIHKFGPGQETPTPPLLNGAELHMGQACAEAEIPRDMGRTEHGARMG